MFSPGWLLLALLPSDGPPAMSSNEVEARWRREYPQAAEKLEQTTRNLVAKGRFSWHAWNGKTTTTEDLTIATSSDKTIFLREGRSLQSPGQPIRREPSIIECATSESHFMLKKLPSETSFAIAEYGPRSDWDDTEFQMTMHWYLRSATVFMHGSLLERMNSPVFAVKAAEVIKEGDRELVRIEYTWEYEKNNGSESGSVFLEPRKDWAIRRAVIDSLDKDMNKVIKFICEVGYEDLGDHGFLPKLMEYSSTLVKPGVSEVGHLELKTIAPGPPPEEMFKMTAYGLPDVPLRAAPRSSMFTFRNPLFWSALAAAVGCFGLLWFLRRRTAQAA